MRAPLRLAVAGTTCLLLIPALTGGAMLVCQEPSPYLPLAHWATPYVEHLIALGVIDDPTPLTRPFIQADVARALERADTARLGAGGRRVVRAMLATLGRPVAGSKPWVRGDGDIAGSGASHARRVTLVTHPSFDTRLKSDPDYEGKKDRFIAGRNAEAYIDARFRYGEVFFGSLERNWGPPALDGLLVSSSPYSYDHLGLVLGTRRLQLQAIVTQLDDLADTTGTLDHRYFIAHRLVWRPGAGRGTTLGLWEGEIAAGPARTLEPWLANILNLGLLVEYDRNVSVNSLLGVDWESRLGGGVKLFGQALLDDIQIDRTTKADSADHVRMIDEEASAQQETRKVAQALASSE